MSDWFWENALFVTKRCLEYLSLRELRAIRIRERRPPKKRRVDIYIDFAPLYVTESPSRAYENPFLPEIPVNPKTLALIEKSPYSARLGRLAPQKSFPAYYRAVNRRVTGTERIPENLGNVVL